MAMQRSFENKKFMRQLDLPHVAEDTANKWLATRNLDAPVSSNVGAANLPFQRWFRFKEAYSPSFVTDAISACDYPIQNILDPFGGSGTTALTARMKGLNSTSIEINPFMADLIRVKVDPVTSSSFATSCRKIIDRIEVKEVDYSLIEGAPPTLVEPGINDRYVYSRETYGLLRALLREISLLDESEARLARILLGSILVECSNVIVNGKGRRYRKNWHTRKIGRADVIEFFQAAINQALEDLSGFDYYPATRHLVYTDDARIRLKKIQSTDLAIFSPPYPNSFDYTDVYNLELWMLGYLRSSEDNRHLRSNTLRSHVQIKWPEVKIKELTATLGLVKEALDDCREGLWNRNIPEMILGYFSDLHSVLFSLHNIVRNGGNVIIAVGDSQYGGVKIKTANILAEIGLSCGYEILNKTKIRPMRSSAQHGGKLDLSENAVCLKRIEV